MIDPKYHSPQGINSQKPYGSKNNQYGQQSYHTQVTSAQGYKDQSPQQKKAQTQQMVPQSKQLLKPDKYQYNKDDRPQSQITQVSGSGKPSVIKEDKPPSFLKTYGSSPNYLDLPKQEKKKEEPHYKINFDPSEYNEKIVELIADNLELKTELITKEQKINDTKENINRLREIINHMKISGQ